MGLIHWQGVELPERLTTGLTAQGEAVQADELRHDGAEGNRVAEGGALAHQVATDSSYLLTGLIGLAPLCGWRLAEWSREQTTWHGVGLALLAALTVSGLVGAAIFLHRVQWPHTIAARDYAAMISTLPEQAVFLVGRRTPLVNYYQRIGAHPGWQTIPFGAGWPDARLGEVVDDYLKAGRPVFVDFDETIWSEGMRARSREAVGLELLRREYRLEPVTASLFRVVGKHSP